MAISARGAKRNPPGTSSGGQVNPSQSELLGLFCQPVQFDGLLADLGMESLAFAFEFLRPGIAHPGPEGARSVVGHDLLPLRDLHRVNVEFLGDLLDGPDPLERLKCHAGLELGVVSSAFGFHFVYVRFVFSAATVHHNHSLASGPIFGVRLTDPRFPNASHLPSPREEPSVRKAKDAEKIDSC